MKKICVLGPVDKRVVTYPLLKVLKHNGKTLVITDDGIYRKFAEDFGCEFSMGVMDFMVTPLVNEEEIKAKGYNFESYEYVVFITTNELPSNCDKVIYCHGVDKSFCRNDVVASIGEVATNEVVISMKPVSDKAVKKIGYNKDLMGYICYCEEAKDFVATKSTAIGTFLGGLLSEELDMPISTIKSVLAREDK